MFAITNLKWGGFPSAPACILDKNIVVELYFVIEKFLQFVSILMLNRGGYPSVA
jgi:hypothetical protein